MAENAPAAPPLIGKGHDVCTCGILGVHPLDEHDDRIRGKVAAGVRGPGPMHTDRHPGTQQIMQWFAHEHLAEGPIRGTSKACADLAAEHLDCIPDGPELTAGLRKLLEAKDCFVRATIAAMRDGRD